MTIFSTYQMAPARIASAVMKDNVILEPGESHVIEEGIMTVDLGKFCLDGLEDVFNLELELEDGKKLPLVKDCYPKHIYNYKPHSTIAQFWRQAGGVTDELRHGSFVEKFNPIFSLGSKDSLKKHIQSCCGLDEKRMKKFDWDNSAYKNARYLLAYLAWQSDTKGTVFYVASLIHNCLRFNFFSEEDLLSLFLEFGMKITSEE